MPATLVPLCIGGRHRHVPRHFDRLNPVTGDIASRAAAATAAEAIAAVEAAEAALPDGRR